MNYHGIIYNIMQYNTRVTHTDTYIHTHIYIYIYIYIYIMGNIAPMQCIYTILKDIPLSATELYS